MEPGGREQHIHSSSEALCPWRLSARAAVRLILQQILKVHSCCNHRHGRHLLHISVTIAQRNYRPLSPTITQSFFFLIVRFEKFILKDKGRCTFPFVNGNLSTTCAHKYARVLNWIFWVPSNGVDFQCHTSVRRMASMSCLWKRMDKWTRV